MVTNFKSLFQVRAFFKEDQTCIDYLAFQRWNVATCPHCGSAKKAYITNRAYKRLDKN